jgi:hypothetical protein
MILALRMAARKPFEFVVYPQSSAVGVLARLLEPRPDRYYSERPLPVH